MNVRRFRKMGEVGFAIWSEGNRHVSLIALECGFRACRYYCYCGFGARDCSSVSYGERDQDNVN